VRIPALGIATLALFGAACASTPDTGALGEGVAPLGRIVGVDTAHPPTAAGVELESPAYGALLLVAPGYSATLLYPDDSTTNNRLSAGTNTLSFRIPKGLLQRDSMLRNPRTAARDTAMHGRRPAIARVGTGPLPPEVPTFLLLVTSPQPLDYRRIREKTVGVSLPVVETEALNAVGKAIKATIATEPRTWAGHYQRIELTRPR